MFTKFQKSLQTGVVTSNYPKEKEQEIDPEKPVDAIEASDQKPKKRSVWQKAANLREWFRGY